MPRKDEASDEVRRKGEKGKEQTVGSVKGGKRQYIQDVLSVAVVLHPALLYLIDEPPSAGPNTL